MNRKLLAVILIIVVVFSIIGCSREKNAEKDKVVEVAEPLTDEQIAEKMRDYILAWVKENYSEHYELSNFEIKAGPFERAGEAVEGYFVVELETRMKYEKVDDSPFFAGIKEVLNVENLDFFREGAEFSLDNYKNIKNVELTEDQARKLQASLVAVYMDTQYSIDNNTELALPMIAKGKVDSEVWELYYDSGFPDEEPIPAAENIPQSFEELKKAGRNFFLESIDEIIGVGK